MPCVTSHYINPTTPKPIYPSPIGEVACHGLEWHSGPCPTLTEPWLDLGLNGLREMTYEFELITCQKSANSHHIGISNICQNWLPLIRRLKACNEVYSSWRIETKGMPMYIPTLPSKPLRIWADALPKSHDLETNSCDSSCAKPNGVREIWWCSTPKHMPTYEQHVHSSTPHRLLGIADQVSTQNAKMSRGQKHENMTKYKVVMIVYLYAHP